MPFTENSSITLTELQNNWTDTIANLKSKTKKVIKNAASSDLTSNLFVCLIDFYFDYAVKKGINPLIPIIHTALTTGYLSDYDDEVKNTNTAKIKVDRNVIDGYSRTNITDTCMVKKFSNWTDSIRAQVDHLALFAGICDDRDLASSNVTHLTFDPNHDAAYKYTNYSVNGVACTAPTIAAMTLMLEATDGSIGSSSVTTYKTHFVQLLNRIVCNNTTGNLLTNGEKASIDSVDDSYDATNSTVANASAEVTLLLNARSTLYNTFNDIATTARQLLFARNP